MDLNRSIYKKRGIIGYKAEDARQFIQTSAERHQHELDLLRDELQKEVLHVNQLRSELKMKSIIRHENPIEAEISKALMEIYRQHTTEILEQKNEFVKVEAFQLEQLELKKQQLEIATKRVDEVLQYLKAIPTQELQDTERVE